jgi:hypothetical protein
MCSSTSAPSTTVIAVASARQSISWNPKICVTIPVHPGTFLKQLTSTALPAIRDVLAAPIRPVVHAIPVMSPQIGHSVGVLALALPPSTTQESSSASLAVQAAPLVPTQPLIAQYVRLTPSEPNQEAHAHATVGMSRRTTQYVQPAAASSPVALPAAAP